MVFPAVFSFGIEPTAGPELVFITLPNIFEQLPFGNAWSFIFFILLALAALTSTISLHEVATAYVHEEYHMTRKKGMPGSFQQVLLSSEPSVRSLSVY